MPLGSWDLNNLTSELLPGRLPEGLNRDETANPGFIDTAAAALRQSNIVSNLYDYAQEPAVPAAQAGYDALSDIAGFEDHADRFFHSGSPVETQIIKQRIRSEMADRRTLGQAGAWGTVANLSAALIDPLTLASMAIPVVAPVAWGSRAVRVGAGVAANAAIDIGEETALHQLQETRTLGESAFRVGAGALLTAGFGALASRIPKSEFEKMRSDLNQTLREVPNQQTLSAMRVGGNTTLHDESIATGAGRAIAATVGRISPILRLFRSGTKEARVLTQELADVPFMLNKNIEKGEGTALSAETRIQQRELQSRITAVRTLDEFYKAYREKNPMNALTQRDFGRQLSIALNMDDQHAIPEVMAAAQQMRKLFEADKKIFQELGALPEEIDLLGAKSYFPHVWDHAAIAADEIGFREKMADHFRRNPRGQREAAEAKIAEQEAAAKLTGGPADETVPTAPITSNWDSAGLLDSSDSAYVTRHVSQGNIVQAVNSVPGPGNAYPPKFLGFMNVGGEQLELYQTVGRDEIFAAKRIRPAAEANIIDADLEKVGTAKMASDGSLEHLVVSDKYRRKGVGTKLAQEAETRLGAKMFKAKDRSSAGAAFLESQRQKKLAQGTGLVAEHAAAKAAQADIEKSIASTVREQRIEAGRVQRAERNADSVAETLAEKEAQLAEAKAELARHPHADTEQAILEKMAKDIAQQERAIERLRNRGMRHGEARAAHEQKLQVAEAELERLKAAGKTAKAATREAEAALSKAKQAHGEAKAELKKAENTASPRDEAEIQAAVQDTLDRIMGTVRGMADIGHVSNPRVLKSRVLDLPYEIKKDYLIHDFEQVMNGYARSVAPQIELRAAFGSTTLENEFKVINEAYQVKRAATTSNEAIEKLRKEQVRVLKDLIAIRDRLLGQVGPRGNDSINLIRTARLIRAYNYVTKLGSQTLSSFSDYGHVITRYGLARTMAKTARFLTSIAANKLIREDAKRMGTALDWLIDTRSGTLADIGDELAGSRMLDRGAQWATNKFTRISGMATWNSSIKAITSALEQDAILRAVQKGADIKPFELAKLAQNGIGATELKRIGAQFEKYGEDTDGLFRARTDLWDDREMAKLLEDSIVKTANIMSIRKGVGDLPVMMNSEMARTLLQFKSFGMAAVNRIMIPVAQGLSHGDAATINGFLSMIALGGLTYVAKEWAAGREPDLTPARLSAESLNWSGVLGYLPDVLDPATGLLPPPIRGMRFSRYSDRTPIQTLLGPSLGTATQLYQTVAGVTDLGISQKDLHAVRQAFVPMQNVFYLRRLFNALEGETGEAIGAEGSTHETFVHRVTKTEKPKK